MQAGVEVGMQAHLTPHLQAIGSSSTSAGASSASAPASSGPAGARAAEGFTAVPTLSEGRDDRLRLHESLAALFGQNIAVTAMGLPGMFAAVVMLYCGLVSVKALQLWGFALVVVLSVSEPFVPRARLVR